MPPVDHLACRETGPVIGLEAEFESAKPRVEGAIRVRFQYAHGQCLLLIRDEPIRGRLYEATTDTALLPDLPAGTAEPSRG